MKINQKDFDKKSNKYLAESQYAKGNVQIITLKRLSATIIGIGNQYISPTSFLIYQKLNNCSQLQGYIDKTPLNEDSEKTILLNMKDSTDAKVYIQDDESYQKLEFNSVFPEEDLLMIYWERAPYSFFYYVFKEQNNLYCEKIFNNKRYSLQSFSKQLFLNVLTIDEKQKVKNLFNAINS